MVKEIARPELPSHRSELEAYLASDHIASNHLDAATASKYDGLRRMWNTYAELRNAGRASADPALPADTPILPGVGGVAPDHSLRITNPAILQRFVEFASGRREDCATAVGQVCTQLRTAGLLQHQHIEDSVVDKLIAEASDYQRRAPVTKTELPCMDLMLRHLSITAWAVSVLLCQLGLRADTLHWVRSADITISDVGERAISVLASEDKVEGAMERTLHIGCACMSDSQAKEERTRWDNAGFFTTSSSSASSLPLHHAERPSANTTMEGEDIQIKWAGTSSFCLLHNNVLFGCIKRVSRDAKPLDDALTLAKKVGSSSRCWRAAFATATMADPASRLACGPCLTQRQGWSDRGKWFTYGWMYADAPWLPMTGAARCLLPCKCPVDPLGSYLGITGRKKKAVKPAGPPINISKTIRPKDKATGVQKELGKAEARARQKAAGAAAEPAAGGGSKGSGR